MPANLTPEYRENERKFREAKDPEEKLRYLELMLATIPKHKGTDHMQGDIKRRISQTKAALEKKSGLKRFNPFKVEREGIGQYAVVGAGQRRQVRARGQTDQRQDHGGRLRVCHHKARSRHDGL